jgi:hypothetical protein
MDYRNSIGSFFGDIFGHTQSARSAEVNTLVQIANQPASINPLIFIVPVVALAVSGIIYFAVIKK